MVKQRDLAAILVEEGSLDQKKADAARALAETKDVALESIIYEQRFAVPEAILAAKGKLWEMPTVSLVGKQIPKEVLTLFSRETAEQYRMIAWQKEGDIISIALVDPGDGKVVEAAEFAAREHGARVSFAVTSVESFEYAFKQYENAGEEISGALEVAAGEFVLPSEEEVGSLQEVTKTAPVSKIVSVIIRDAIEGEASDIHIEPLASETQVRYRVDGVLHVTLKLPAYVHDAIVSRIKVLSHMKIDETRAPQDGRMRLTMEGKSYDLRVSIMPLLDHEKVVIRILDTSRGAPPLEALGFGARELRLIRQRMNEPHGMILITGPTGSGKTTTLFSVIQMLNKEGVNISTLEDPIEYFISGVSQSQIRPEIGFTFATGLRSILRQDPDIVMVGEIRDTETASLAVHAGLTGHLVLSTLHTNSALGAIPRLIDMEVEPYLLASTLLLVEAQRLVRKICEYCKTPLHLSKEVEARLEQEIIQIPKDVFAQYKLSPERPYTFWHGKGCVRCGRTGYKGRTALGEAIDVTAELKELVAQKATEDALSKEIQLQGFITMRQNGILKALIGDTTIEEIILATREE